jgi:hypothetical protein
VALIVEFQIEFCIREWSTGQFIQGVFNKKAGLDSYNTHLQDLKEWYDGNKVVIGNILNKLFERAL